MTFLIGKSLFCHQMVINSKLTNGGDLIGSKISICNNLRTYSEDALGIQFCLHPHWRYIVNIILKIWESISKYGGVVHPSTPANIPSVTM